ncbi:hypothetical protein HK098_006357 [Nowakowskiella sp. JEL0407]|nr:hypothetical protein HK098_006357 [Nowakowskiella sp. JEL0407]
MQVSLLLSLCPLIFAFYDSKLSLDPDSPVFDRLIENVRTYIANINDTLTPLRFTKLERLKWNLSYSYDETVEEQRFILCKFRSLYSQLSKLDIHVNHLKCDYDSLLTTLTHICNNNHSLTSIVFNIIRVDTAYQCQNWNEFAASISQLPNLARYSSILKHNEVQAIILDALTSATTLQELKLVAHASCSVSMDSALCALLAGCRLRTFHLEGINASRDVIESIKRCKSLMSLSLEIPASDVAVFFSAKVLPISLSVNIYVKRGINRKTHPYKTLSYDFKGVDFTVNFQGVKFLKMTSTVALPECIFRQLKNSKTLRDISLLLYEDSSAMHTINYLVDDVETLSSLTLDLDNYHLYDYPLLLETIQSSQHLKNLTLTANSGTRFDHAISIFAKNSSLEHVAIHYDYPEFDLGSLIQSIMENPMSSIKNLIVSKFTGSEIEIVFGDEEMRWDYPTLFVRKYPRSTHRTVSDLLLELIECCNEGDLLMESFIFDDLSHVEWKELKIELGLEERLKANDRLHVGYKNRYFCLWCEDLD